MKLWERFMLWALSPPKQVVLNDSSVLVTKDEETDALRVELRQEFGDVVLRETVWGWDIYIAEIDKNYPVAYLDLFNVNEEERVDGSIFQVLIEDPQSQSGEPVAIAKYFPDHISVVVNPDAEWKDGPRTFNWDCWDGGGVGDEIDFT